MTDETLELKIKTNLKKRIFATIIDYGIFILVFYLYIMFFGKDNDQGGKTVSGFLGLPLLTFWLIYFVVIEGFYGGTLAHQGLYLKVLTIDRKEIGLGQALTRHLLDFIDIFFYGIPAMIAIKNSEKHQRIGDMCAKTIVVDMTDPEQYLENQTNLKTDDNKTSR